MATTLELISAIREHIVAQSTGRLVIRFPDAERVIQFAGGQAHIAEDSLESCLNQPPIEFRFEGRDVGPSENAADGAGILVEALGRLDASALARIWEPYRDWTVSFLQDPAVHGSRVSEHLDGDPARLGRLLRVAVIGALRLDPPSGASVQEDLERVIRAANENDPWKVMNLSPFASRAEIKRRYRELARRLHPDRWPGLEDAAMRQRLADAFRDVRASYEIVIAMAAASTTIPGSRAAGDRETLRAANAYGQPASAANDSLFHRILEGLTKAS